MQTYLDEWKRYAALAVQRYDGNLFAKIEEAVDIAEDNVRNRPHCKVCSDPFEPCFKGDDTCSIKCANKAYRYEPIEDDYPDKETCDLHLHSREN